MALTLSAATPGTVTASAANAGSVSASSSSAQAATVTGWAALHAVYCSETTLCSESLICCDLSDPSGSAAGSLTLVAA